MHIVNAANPRCFLQRAADGFDFLVVGGAVHQVMQRIPAEFPTHFRHHEADDECGDGIEDGVTGEVADDTYAYHQRGGRVGACVPCVGHQHARLDALGDAEHVAEQQLLGDKGAGGDPESEDVHGLHGLGRFELAKGRPEHANADGQEQCAQCQRCRGFETLVAVGMVFIGRLLAVMAGEKYDKIGHQVGQGMNAIGDQALGLGQQAGADLRDGEQQVDADADPGAARCRRGTFGRIVFGVFGIVGEFSEFHVGLVRRECSVDSCNCPAGPVVTRA